VIANIFDLITFDVSEEKIDRCGPGTGEFYEYTILKQAKPGGLGVSLQSPVRNRVDQK
jgi:hypothetical protein